jgi:hypothetical protein
MRLVRDVTWLLLRTNQSDNCWIWQLSCDKWGYGKVDGDLAHRVAWRAYFGEIPKGLWVLHSCDNPPCVNPKHLFLGTHADNVEDKVAKGRQAKYENGGLAKLTQAEVRKIRAWYRPHRAGANRRGQTGFREGSQRWLAEKFKVAPSCIAQILSRETWKGVE